MTVGASFLLMRDLFGENSDNDEISSNPTGGLTKNNVEDMVEAETSVVEPDMQFGTIDSLFDAYQE